MSKVIWECGDRVYVKDGLNPLCRRGVVCMRYKDRVLVALDSGGWFDTTHDNLRAGDFESMVALTAAGA